MSNTAQSKAALRISALLDENSFVEIGKSVTARSTDFNLTEEKTPSDGVITGYGLIDDSLVYVYSQDASVLGGSIGEMHAKKIARLYDLAVKMGAPVIGLIDCAGVRLQESVDALNAFGEVYRKMALASGVIPQITAVLGQCGGGLAVAAGLSDFVYMEKSAKLFVNAPNAIAGNKTEDTASAEFQSQNTGLADFVGTEDEIFAQIRALVSMLPANNADEAPLSDVSDDLNRACADIADAAGDTSVLLSEIADDGVFCEVRAASAREMVTGFLKLNGTTIGAVANRTEVFDAEGKKTADFKPVLTAKGCDKAASFVKFCDAFDIPVLTVTNAEGFLADKHNEFRIARSAAALTAAFAEATTAKVNLIVGNAYGSGFTIMNSQALGADITFAWDTAKVGTMDAKLAAGIMYDGADAAVIDEKAAEYEKKQNSVDAAASRGYIDTVISPEDTRKMVIGAFEMLYTKREDLPAKKHSAV